LKNIFICIFLVLNILGADCCSQTENCDILPKPNTAYIIADSNSTTIAVHLENNRTWSHSSKFETSPNKKWLDKY